MFLQGLATGFATGANKSFDEIRERVKQQTEVARQHREVMKKRKAEADAVKTQIRNAAKTYGVDEKVIFSSYKNGHMDSYIKTMEAAREKAAMKGMELDGQTLANMYKVPAYIYDSPDFNMDEEINKAFGTVLSSIDGYEPEEETYGNVLLQALGMNQEQSVNRQLSGVKMGEGSAYDLQNLPEISPLQGDGGSFTPEAYQLSNPDPKETEEKPLFTAQQRAEAAAAEIVGRVRSRIPGLADSTKADALEKRMIIAIQRYMVENEITDQPLTPEQVQEAAKDLIMEKDGMLGIKTGEEWEFYTKEGLPVDNPNAEREPDSPVAAPSVQPTSTPSGDVPIGTTHQIAEGGRVITYTYTGIKDSNGNYIFEDDDGNIKVLELYE